MATGTGHRIVAESLPPRRTGHLVLGATVRTLGAWPAGWRAPGAHRDPREDPQALVRIARAAEDAGLQFLYFGDWLATSAEYEHTDPYLLARLEPFAAVGYLAALTSRIGLIATVSSSHAEPYSTARVAASIDLLSGGRVGLCVTSGSESQSAGNFSGSPGYAEDDRIGAAAEFIEILRGLWDSWRDDAFVADAKSARLIDRAGLRAIDYRGRFRSAAGPLNVVRPPQGHPPIMVVGSAENSRRLAAQTADLSFFSPGTLEEAVDYYATTRHLAASVGRDPDEIRLLSTVFPVVADTREAAWALYDDLVQLTPVELVSGRAEASEIPANRTIRSLAEAVGVSLNGILVDDVVSVRLAQRFGDYGRQLLQVVQSRSGRTVGGDRPVTFRQLIVARAIVAPIIVGSFEDIADHFEAWFRRRAVDGFTVLSAHTEQLEAFVGLVVPELRRRGLFPTEYAGTTLRDQLGLERPANSFDLASNSPLHQRRPVAKTPG